MAHLTDDELLDMADGLASPAQQRTGEAHLESCESCRIRYHECKAVSLQLSEMLMEQPSVDFTDQVLEQWQAVAQKVKQEQRLVRRLPYIFLGLMVACAGVIVYLLSDASAAVYHIPALERIPYLAKDPSVLNVLLLINAGLLLWIFNQRILHPYFKSRMENVAVDF